MSSRTGISSKISSVCSARILRQSSQVRPIVHHGKALQKLTNTAAVTDSKAAMSSAAALVTYLGLMADDSNFGSYHLKPHDLSQYLKLDASALKALNCATADSKTVATLTRATQ